MIFPDAEEDEYDKAALEDQSRKAVIPSRKCWDRTLNYLHFRWKISTVRVLYVENQLTTQQADSIVNTITLLNALLLTIPFSIVGSLNNSYWDWLEVSINKCTVAPFDWHSVYDKFQNAIFASVYPTLISLVLAVLYYLLRPEEPTVFRIWWKRSKGVIIITMINTIVSIISILTLLGYLVNYFVNSTAFLCNVLDPSVNHELASNFIAIILFIVCAAYAIIVMF